MAEGMTLTPEEALATLVSMFPDFESEWDCALNYHRADNEAFTLWGLFALFSDYVRDNFGAMPEQKRRELMAFIEWCVADGNDPGNAACTCFLENLAGEPPLSGQLRRYMGPKSTAFFDHWYTGAEQPSV